MNALVIREIVEKNLCIGCGLCAATCPSHFRKMDYSLHGECNHIRKIIISYSGNSDRKRKKPACTEYPEPGVGIFSPQKRCKPTKIIHPIWKKAQVLMNQLWRFFP